MNPDDPFPGTSSGYVPGWIVTAPASSAQHYASAQNSPDFTHQYSQGPVPQMLAFGEGHGGYPSRFQAPTGTLQYQTPRHGMEPSPEAMGNKPVRRKRSSRGAQRSQVSRGSGPSRSRATITQQPTTGSNGLLFRSCADALAATDKMFRAPLKKIVNDNVDEIERDKSSSVLRIVNALKHTEFMPPPETKIDRKRIQTNLTNEEKQVWLEWQNDADETVKVKLRQRNSGAKCEYYAWEIIEEMVKLHRMGYRFASQGKDVKSKCSQRIDTAVQVIKDYAIVRKKLLKGDNIANFCTGPESYAKKTVSSLWNNSSRAQKRAAMQASGDGSTPVPKGRRRIPTDDGAIALGFEDRITVTKRKRAAKAAASTDTVEEKPTDVGQERSSEAPRSTSEAPSYPEGGESDGEEGGEESDEDEVEDEEEDEEDEDEDDEDEDDGGEENDEDDEDDESEESAEGQSGSTRTGTYQQSYIATPGPTQVDASVLPQSYPAVVPQFHYPSTYVGGSLLPARSANTPTQASHFQPLAYPNIPALAWTMERQTPSYYEPTTTASNVVSATTAFDVESIYVPTDMFSTQARTYGSEPSYDYRAAFTSQSTPVVPSNDFSDPLDDDPYYAGSAPPSAKRRRH